MDFGFSLSPSSRIDLDLFDRDVLKCMACGSCTATCTAGKFAKNSLRSAILCLQNGQQAQALEYLKPCMLCGKCFMVCPRGINTRHLILSILKIYGDTK